MKSPLEKIEQKALIKRVMLDPRTRDVFYHIPNEGKRTVWHGKDMKAQGLRPGMPDNCLPVATRHFSALYIELKRRDATQKSVTKNQIDMIKALEAAGNCCVVAFGWEDAWSKINYYLNDGIMRTGYLCP